VIGVGESAISGRRSAVSSEDFPPRLLTVKAVRRNVQLEGGGTGRWLSGVADHGMKMCKFLATSGSECRSGGHAGGIAPIGLVCVVEIRPL